MIQDFQIRAWKNIVIGLRQNSTFQFKILKNSTFWKVDKSLPAINRIYHTLLLLKVSPGFRGLLRWVFGPKNPEQDCPNP